MWLEVDMWTFSAIMISMHADCQDSAVEVSCHLPRTRLAGSPDSFQEAHVSMSTGLLTISRMVSGL